MTTPVTRLTDRTAWQRLRAHYQKVGAGLQLRQLFADDPARGERMTVEAVGLYLDYSRTASPTKPSNCC